MKFENTYVYNIDNALRGMRNPKESWNKSDSHWDAITDIDDIGDYHYYVIGQNDMKLAQTLIRSGSQHRKFLRQMFVCVDITAPFYFWKQFDTYKIGTVANSTSTMHKLTSKPITRQCFDVDDISDDMIVYDKQPYDYDTTIEMFSDQLINALETLRKKYVQTKDKRYWKQLVRWMPNSWLQKRTVTMNYENLLGMCSKGQRRYHKLNEWSGQDNNNVPNFISWARTLPYAKQFIFIDEGDKDD